MLDSEVKIGDYFYYKDQNNGLFLALSSVILVNVFFSDLFKWVNLIFLALWIIFFLWIKIEIKYGLFLLFFLFIFSLMNLFFSDKFFLKNADNYFSYLNNFFNFHNFFTSFIERKYNPKISSFINLLLFNKSKFELPIYRELKDLGIAHLITISGFHFVLLNKFFIFLFGKNQKIRSFISFPIFLVFGAANNYSIPTTRILITFLIGEKNKFKKGSIATLVSIFTNFYLYLRISFLLSYITHLIFLIIYDFSKDKFINFAMINILVPSFVYYLILPFSKKIVFLLPFNLIIFTPFISFFFFYFFLSFSLVFLRDIHIFLIEFFMKFIEFFEFGKLFIDLSFLNPDFFILPIIFVSLTSIYLYSYRYFKLKSKDIKLEKDNSTISYSY